MKAGELRYAGEAISFSVLERPARRTLGIEVHPDGRVLVLAPSGCDNTTIDEKLRLRARWISKQRDIFARYERPTSARQYLSGEAHRYLGRQYRLRVRASDCSATEDHVHLGRNEITVAGPHKLPAARVRELLRRWLLHRAREVFAQTLRTAFEAFKPRGLAMPRLAVREMKTRWGSLSANGQMTLNTKLIQAPRACVEYVIVHELCHMLHRDHSPEFFAALSQAMPDWRQRKQRLENAVR